MGLGGSEDSADGLVGRAGCEAGRRFLFLLNALQVLLLLLLLLLWLLLALIVGLGGSEDSADGLVGGAGRRVKTVECTPMLGLSSAACCTGDQIES